MKNVRNKSFWRRFLPNLYVNDLSEISLELLKEKGIKGLILDLDNTLVAWNQHEPPPETISWVQKAKEMGFLVFIVSNALEERVQHFSWTLGVPGISKAQKPRRSALRSAVLRMNLSLSEVAVIGDQVLTDVWGGNRLGIYTILVRPLNPKEFFFTRLGRMFERMVLRRFSLR
ncbi:MAG: YqeG family HAD IIIA-type phosphatase [Candidatus Atribacteria bacterium]|nr:YqeG family HAD IIIA-type phosphatase [Candidatus Atribacteria bacterium]